MREKKSSIQSSKSCTMIKTFETMIYQFQSPLSAMIHIPVRITSSISLNDNIFLRNLIKKKKYEKNLRYLWNNDYLSISDSSPLLTMIHIRVRIIVFYFNNVQSFSWKEKFNKKKECATRTFYLWNNAYLSILDSNPLSIMIHISVRVIIFYFT